MKSGVVPPTPLPGFPNSVDNKTCNVIFFEEVYRLELVQSSNPIYFGHQESALLTKKNGIAGFITE